MSFISSSLVSSNSYLTQQKTQANAYIAQQTASTKTAGIVDESQPSSDPKVAITYVALSPVGQKMAAQDKLWSTLSPLELKGVFDRSWEKFTQLDDKFRAVGMTAFDADIPTNGTVEKTEFATKIRDYMVSMHSLPPGKVANPYTGYSREALSSVIYDESGAYTPSEAYAAAAEQQKQDFIHFSALFASNATSDDHRQMYVGILDFYSNLSPVEQSAYPVDYKEQVNGFLKQEETIFGLLNESDKKEAIERNRGLSPVSFKSDEPAWTQLIKLTSRPSNES